MKDRIENLRNELNSLKKELNEYRLIHCTVLSSNGYTDSLTERIYEIKDELRALEA